MTMAQAFDEWMRKYKEDPSGFENGMQSAKAHDRPSKGSTEGVSEYGDDCATLLARLMAVGTAAWDPVPAAGVSA
jgi:hypothetical protein